MAHADPKKEKYEEFKIILPSSGPIYCTEHANTSLSYIQILSKATGQNHTIVRLFQNHPRGIVYFSYEFEQKSHTH